MREILVDLLLRWTHLVRQFEPRRQRKLRWSYTFYNYLNTYSNFTDSDFTYNNFTNDNTYNDFTDNDFTDNDFSYHDFTSTYN